MVGTEVRSNSAENFTAVPEAAIAPESPPSVSRALEIHDQPAAKHLGLQELRQRRQIQDGIRSLLGIHESGVFQDQQIIQLTKGWAERYGANEQNLVEILNFFQSAESIFVGDFSSASKIEITCALAERVADGTFDAETLRSLVWKVVDRGSSGTTDRVAEYSQKLPIIGVYSELDRDIDGCPQNKSHIINHEIAHGVDRYLDISSDEEIRQHLTAMIADGNLRQRESYRSQNAVDQHLAAENQEESAAWLSGELLAEKIAAYLQSGADFAGFLNAIWRVTPAENQRQLMRDKEQLDAWTEENRFFFDKISASMADKTAMKEKVLTATAEGRAKLDQMEEDDFDSDEFFSGSVVDPGVPDTSKSRDNNQSGEGFLQMMASGFVNLAESSRPVVEVVPGTDAKAA